MLVSIPLSPERGITTFYRKNLSGRPRRRQITQFYRILSRRCHIGGVREKTCNYLDTETEPF